MAMDKREFDVKIQEIHSELERLSAVVEDPVRILSEYKGIRRSMNVSCGRRLTEATFTCVRGFPYGRLCASRMDDTAETQTVKLCGQRTDRKELCESAFVNRNLT